jgi:hypothetical protein
MGQRDGELVGTMRKMRKTAWQTKEKQVPW